MASFSVPDDQYIVPDSAVPSETWLAEPLIDHM
jgi:hypothetical protein